MGLLDFFKKSKQIIVAVNQAVDKKQVEVCAWKTGGADSIYSNIRFLKWWSFKPKSLNGIVYPEWMKYECEITNPIAKTKSFIKKGYLIECDTATYISHLTANDLKEILKAQDLSVLGKKQDLINRIYNEVDMNLIRFDNKMWTISEAGLSLLDEYSEVLVADSFRSYGVTIENYLAAKEELSEIMSPNDILWYIFNKNILAYSHSKDFGLLRSTYLSMAQFCERKKDYTESEKYYCAVLRYDLSGLGNSDTYNFSDVCVLPFIIDSIQKHKEKYNESYVLTFCQKLYIPRTFLDFCTFQKVLKDILAEKEIDLENYLPKTRGGSRI